MIISATVDVGVLAEVSSGIRGNVLVLIQIAGIIAVARVSTRATMVTTIRRVEFRVVVMTVLDRYSRLFSRIRLQLMALIYVNDEPGGHTRAQRRGVCR